MDIQKLKAIHAALGELLKESEPVSAATVGQVYGAGQNAYAGATPIWAGHVPAEFQVGAGRTGTRPDIGGPGWQADLRKMAALDGKEDRNAYVKDRKLTPIWPDTKQNWEQ